MHTSTRTDSHFAQEYVKFLLVKYLKNWYWFVLAILISFGATYLLLTTIKPVYSTKASVLIETNERSSSAKDDIMRELDMFSSEKNIENEIEILKSYALAEKVVDDLNLDVNYMVKDGLYEKDIYNRSPIKVRAIKPNEAMYEQPVEVKVHADNVTIDGKAYPYNQPVTTPVGQLLIQKKDSVRQPYTTLFMSLMPKEGVAKAYSKNLKVSQPSRGASVLHLDLEDTSIERAVAYLNRLVHWYDLSSLQHKNRTGANTLQFITGRLGIISRELSDVEKHIQNYKTRSGIVNLSAESTVFLDKVRENDTQLNQVNIQLGALDEIEGYINSKSEKRGLAPATLGLENPVLTGLLTNLFELEMQREKLSKSSPEGSSAIQVIDNQIRLTKTNIADNTQSLRKILLNTRNKVTASNKKVEAVIQTIPQKERVLLDISRQQGIKGELYTYLLQKREETALSLAATVSDLRVVDAPKGDPTRIKPRKSAYYLFALVMGLLVPIALLWLLDFLNNKINRKAEVEAGTKAPVLGEVVEGALASPLEVSPSSRSLVSEQIRALRANIQFFTMDAGPSQVILVTSSISGEGKSFISLNLAASMSITGRRVALLEMDLRKPKLHKYLNMSSGPGLSNYLVGQAEVEDIIQIVEGYPDLTFVASGPLPPNPSELLNSKRMAALFETLKQYFDVIIADTPPIGLVSDAYSLAPHADMTIYILRHLYTNRAYLKMVESLYQEKRFPNMSVVINGIQVKKEYEYNYGYGYDSEYGYGYGYRSGYHDEDESVKTVVRKGFSLFSKFRK